MSHGTRHSSTKRQTITMPPRVALAATIGLLAAGLTAPANAAPTGPDAPAPSAAEADETLSTHTADSVVLQTLQTQGEADFFIGFDDHADLSAAYDMSDWDARGAWVADQLRATAEKSQHDVRTVLDKAGVDYEPFWIANSILVHDAPQSVAERVIRFDNVVHLHEVQEFPVPSLRKDDVTTKQLDPVEWGIEAIGADRVWSEIGVRGEDIVVAGIDTGVQFDHPALVDRYRGNNGDGTFSHDYNWFDPAGVCGTPNVPCDTQGHGTHTMGTAVGGTDDEGTGIGVAPGARWIAAKGCEAADGVDCSLESLLRAGQWTLEPTDRNGDDPRADLRPHIVNNSWGADTGPIADPFYDQIVRAWNASGMFAVFSNGNDGENGCRTSGSPADSPHAYAVGAYDQENNIAEFSSRGPAADGQIRPNISAPGVGIRSALPRDRYAYGNGTSMAAPHVAGTVALLWSAAPALVGDVNSTRELLDQSAVDTEDLSCGGTAENNNVFGEGRLNAYAAVTAAPTGPTGTLTGIVTNAESGETLPRVSVTATRADDAATVRRTSTGTDGEYSIVLPTGDYVLQFDTYAYRPADGIAVAVTEDDATRHDQTLEPLPTVTLSGTVTDGSGQGWPMYAALDISGYPDGTVFTDPETGRYEVELPADTRYSVLVTTEYGGYVHTTEQVEVGSSATTADFELEVDVEAHCPALGYEPTYAGRFETFDDNRMPEGWTVETEIGDGWLFDNLDERDNGTGGSGGYAMVNSNDGKRVEASVLTSPATDLSDADTPELAFQTELFHWRRSTASAEVSVDGGQTWEVVWSLRDTQRGPHLVRIPLPQAAGVDDVRVRFDYDGGGGSQEGLWQVDNILLGEVSCTPLEGGLVVGQVSDDRTDLHLDGATVAIGDARTETVETPADLDLVGGFYWMFSPETGTVTVTAENPLGQHHPATVETTVESHATTRVDIALSSGELVFDTSPGELSAVLGESAEKTVTVTNVGTAPTTFELVERDAAMEVPDPHDSEWTRLADMRSARHKGLVGVNGNTLVYIGGSGNGASPISQRNYTYNIEHDEWHLTEDFQDFRSASAGGFVGDLMYVIGGSGGTRGLQSTVLIYDPATDTWTQGADAPYAFISAGSAIYEEKVYVIGGWDDDGIINDVSVYDPATDTWDTAAPYPENVAGQMCGAVDGTIYCAGGVTRDDGETRQVGRAYGYRPGTDDWFRIEDLPVSVVAAGHTAANGLFMLSGGLVGGYRSNEGFYYDPAVGTWQDMPRSLFDLYHVGSGCGFYKVGGTKGRPGFFPWVEVLPGFDDCDTTGGDRVAWLSESGPSASGPSETLQPGESITLTLTADTRKLDQPGEYGAELFVLEDTPHRNLPLQVSLDVARPDRWGTITGTVTGLERCDASPSPIEGATVRFTANDLDVSVKTDESGNYVYHLPVPRGRFEATASADGMLGETKNARPVVPGQTRTIDFELRKDEPCAVADPGEATVEIAEGGSEQITLTLSNADGAAPFDFTASDTSAALDPVPGADVSAAPDAAVDETPEWTDATPVPGGRRTYGHAQCAMQPDVTYMIGGNTADNPLTRRSWAYDAGTDSWTELAQIPETSRSMRAVCEAGKIHAFVGDGVDRHFVYDVARDSWSEATPLPRPVDNAAVGAWNGKIYVAGGEGDGDVFNTLDTVYVYDVGTEEWSEGPPMPTSTALAGFTQSGPHLYVIGGQNRQRPWGDWELDVAQRLNLATGEWSTGPALQIPRSELGAVATSEAVYAIGGRVDSPYGRISTDSVERLALSGWDDGEWRDDNVAQLPEPALMNVAGWCTEARAGGEIWAAGGGRLVNRSLYLPVPGESCVGAGPDAPWLSLDAVDGSVEAGGTAALTVTVDATELEPGTTHTATVIITTTDPGAPVIRVPIHAAVTTKEDI